MATTAPKAAGDNSAAANLVALCFAARTAAHFAHLKTRSFAQHKALNEFYDGIVDAADKFAEAYQGRFGLITEYPAVEHLNDDDPLNMVHGLRQWIDEHRDAATKGASELENIVDELQDLNDKAIYQLKFLK